MSKYCCEMFKSNHGLRDRITWFVDSWHVSGFRSGYILVNIKYCPFCGKELIPYDRKFYTDEEEQDD